MTKKKELNEEGLNQIIERFNKNEIEISNAYGDGGHQDPWARFHRAAINQIGGGESTVSRYAIWSNTVRDNLIKVLEEIDDLMSVFCIIYGVKISLIVVQPFIVSSAVLIMASNG